MRRLHHGWRWMSIGHHVMRGWMVLGEMLIGMLRGVLLKLLLLLLELLLLLMKLKLLLF